MLCLFAVSKEIWLSSIKTALLQVISFFYQAFLYNLSFKLRIIKFASVFILTVMDVKNSALRKTWLFSTLGAVQFLFNTTFLLATSVVSIFVFVFFPSKIGRMICHINWCYLQSPSTAQEVTCGWGPSERKECGRCSRGDRLALWPGDHTCSLDTRPCVWLGWCEKY